jgi:hypothetical protein
VSNYDKFVAEIKREVTAIANKITEQDWLEATADLEQLQIYLEEIDGYDGTEESDYSDFYSSSNKTLFETEIAALQLGNKTKSKWQLGFDFIKVTSVYALTDVNEWEIEYGLIIKEYDINFRAIVENGVVNIQQYESDTNYDDEDFGVYSNLEHYKLLAILKQ